MQSDVAVTGNTITGDLNFIEGGLSPSGTLSGDGWFVALKWSDPEDGVTSLKVGLIPSASGLEPQECIDDPDRNGVFKITPDLNQKLVVIQANDAGKKTTQTFDLDFTFLPADEDNEGV